MKDRFYLVLGLTCLIVIIGIIGYKSYQTIYSVANGDDECKFCPVELLEFEFLPDEVRIGQQVTLRDGLCNHSDTSVNLQMYLGAQSLGETLTIRTIDLLTKTDEYGEMIAVKDTPEGRLPRVLTANECIANSPIVAPIPATFTPGLWVLRVHIVVTGPLGETQHINETSNLFEVLP